MKKGGRISAERKVILGRGNDNGLDMLVRLISFLPSTRTISKAVHYKKVLYKEYINFQKILIITNLY